MAKNGTITQYFALNAYTQGVISRTTNSASATYSLTFDWTVTSQDIMNNRSTVEWSLKATALDFDSYDSAVIDFTKIDSILFGGTSDGTDINITIGSTSLHSSTSWSTSLKRGESNKLLASGTKTISHSSDGTLSATVTAGLRVKNIYDSAGTVGWREYSDEDLGNASYHALSGTVTFDAIPRYAMLTDAPNFTDEENPTISFVIPSGVTNVKAYIALDGETQSIAARSVSGSSYTFNFTDAEKAILWSILNGGVTTKQIRFYLTSTHSGTNYKDFLTRTLTVVNYTPTLDPEVYDTVDDIVDRLTGNKYILVRYASKPYFNTGATGRKGATINTQSVKNGETTLYGASGTFDSVTSNLFTFSATDSFGRSVSADMEFSKPNYFVDYVKLTASVEVTEMTADGDVAVTLKGKYFNGSFGKRNNSMRMHYDIAKNNGEPEHVDKGYIYPTMDGSDYSYTFTIPGLDYLSVYDLTVRVSDEISVEPTEVNVIVASTPIFDWGRTDFNFNVPVTIQGASVPTIQAQGTAGIWTYRTWSDGTAECWGKKDVSVTFPSTANWGSLYTTGAISASNVSFPYGLFAETPVVNASLLIRSVGGILMAPGGNDSNKATWDQTGVYEIARGAYVSGTQYYTINYDVKGRWK